MAAEGLSVGDAAGRWMESCPSPCTVLRKGERGDSQVTARCPGHPLPFLAGQARTGCLLITGISPESSVGHTGPQAFWPE